jgi:hypothetical protein
MTFLSRLKIQELDEEHRNWQLLGHLKYVGNQQTFKAPKGFITNFTSVPRIFWSIVSPWGRQMKAAIMHDYFYHTGVVSRLDADKLFCRMMKELGVSWWKRQIMYRAVRLFGAKHYKV